VPNDPVFVPRPPAGDGRSTLLDRVEELRRDPRVGALALVLVAVAAGVVWFRISVAAPPAQQAAAAAVATESAASTVAKSSTSSSTTEPSPRLVVHVAGAVRAPGVVTLDAGARVVDALEAAGGAVAKADLDRLNLAAPVADGERVLVVRRGEPPVAEPLDPAALPGEPAVTPSGPVNVNTATATELEALPGIGPALAAAIIEERERRGGFGGIEELEAVRGIGTQRLADLEGLVTV
jgi:competence protein ComEA